MSEPSERRLLLALLAVQVAFGGMGVAAKLVFPAMSAMGLAMARLGVAAIVLVVLERSIVRSKMPPARDLAMFGLFALLGTVLNMALYLAGLERTTATNAILLIATIPAFTLLIAVLMRREKADWVQAAGLALSFVGVVALVAFKGGGYRLVSIVGDLMVVANSLCYSIYLVLSKPYLARYDSLTMIMWVFVLGAIEFTVVGFPALAGTEWGALAAINWVGLAYVLLAGTVFTYSVNAWVLRHTSASHVANFIYLQPIVGVLAASLVLGEALDWRIAIAGAIILGGVMLATRGFRSRRADKPF